ncbi:Uncharacterised protein [Bordetella pertussis]|nr:Uncharacterised protein [Bordetella pertussis]
MPSANSGCRWPSRSAYGRIDAMKKSASIPSRPSRPLPDSRRPWASPSSSISPPSIRSATSCTTGSGSMWTRSGPPPSRRSAPPLPTACSRFR